ncbi:MAG: type I-E CRISPR-associated protein Cse1/CasA, partial [Thermoguttaceae bacterium]|nr:type I-E CRISPR-associated protein Cse1/CasA [Thermoguttaceae bacterium]
MKNSSGESVGAPRSFNLVDEPWIPVVDAAGEAFKVGLRELFERSEELVDLAVGTLERISLYRLLICVAQRALNGPKNEDEWLEA